MAKQATVKVRIAGNVVEAWEYEKPIFLEGNNGGGRRKSDEPKSEKAAEYKKQNNRKSKDKFRSLVSTNFGDGDKFITLTFRDTEKFDIRNVKDTNWQFKKFMQRMKYKYGDFKYIAVIEFQDEHKRGAVHYHFIAKLGFVPFDDLAAIWGLGFVGINRIEGIDNIGAYISKYMSKDMNDERLGGKKNYLPSKNLEKPTTLYGKVAKDTLEALINKDKEKEQKKEVFANCYDSEHFGNISYKQYNTMRDVKETVIGAGLKEKMEFNNKLKDYQNLIGLDKEKSLVEKVEELNEQLLNGEHTNDRTILESIQKRAKEPVYGKRDWDNLLETVLESFGGGKENDKPSSSGKLVKDYGLEYQLNFDWHVK